MGCFLNGVRIVFAVVMLVGWLIYGIDTFSTGLDDKRLASGLATAPVTPIEDLEKFAGTGKLVRVEAKMTDDPLLTAANGEVLGMEEIVLTHEESSGRSTKTVTDYDHVAPTRFLIGGGTHYAVVNATNIDSRFLRKRVETSIPKTGILPANVKNLISPTFKTLPSQTEGTVTVYTINKEELVTVYGKVTMEKDVPVLSSESADKLFIVSPLPFSQLISNTSKSGWGNLLWGGFCILVPVGFLCYLGYALIADRLKARRK